MPDTRPSVQAILTADTLIEHYVRAVERVRAAVDPNDAELDAQMGDANRTYPTIWEQLDTARAVLAAEGADLSAYDEVRAQLGAGGVIGIETERSEVVERFNLFAANYYQEQTLTLRFNLRGVNLAHRASAALKAAMPDVDWVTLRREANAPVADLTTASNKTWALVALAIALSLIVLRYILK